MSPGAEVCLGAVAAVAESDIVVRHTPVGCCTRHTRTARDSESGRPVSRPGGRPQDWLQWSRTRGGNGPLLGGMVSLPRILLSAPTTVSSPPPSIIRHRLATLMASSGSGKPWRASASCGAYSPTSPRNDGTRCGLFPCPLVCSQLDGCPVLPPPAAAVILWRPASATPEDDVVLPRYEIGCKDPPGRPGGLPPGPPSSRPRLRDTVRRTSQPSGHAGCLPPILRPREPGTPRRAALTSRSFPRQPPGAMASRPKGIDAGGPSLTESPIHPLRRQPAHLPCSLGCVEAIMGAKGERGRRWVRS